MSKYSTHRIQNTNRPPAQEDDFAYYRLRTPCLDCPRDPRSWSGFNDLEEQTAGVLQSYRICISEILVDVYEKLNREFVNDRNRGRRDRNRVRWFVTMP